MIAASAWIDVRMRFTSGCCAVRETPAVCAWKRIHWERSFFALKRSFISRAQMRRGARHLADSSKKSLGELKQKERRGANASPRRPPHWDPRPDADPPPRLHPRLRPAH